MEDSNILYYVILGAIYFLSKFFGKKKKPEPFDSMEEVEPTEAPQQPRSNTPTFEDIFKELTGEKAPDFTSAERTAPLKPMEVEPVLATELIDYQRKNEEAVAPDELIDIVPHKQIQRERPVFERDERFEIEEDDDEFREGLRDLLSDQDGLKKAVVLKELLDRKY